jgi:hypothetical protein
MDMIYYKTTMVYAWIGLSHVDVDLLRWQNLAWQWFELVKDEPVDDITDREELSKSPDLVSYLTRAAFEIFSEPYWGRLWIMQDPALPRSIRLQYGGNELSLRYSFVLKSLPE